MSGHLDARAVDPGVPATFSRKVLTDVLRGELGFGGVVVTDALNMAPAKRWPPAEAARAGAARRQRPAADAAGPGRRVHAGLTAALARRPPAAGAAGRGGDPGADAASSGSPPARSRAALDSLSAPAHVAAVAALDRAAVTQLRGRCAAPVGGTGHRHRLRRAGPSPRLAGRVAARGRRTGWSTPAGPVVHLVGYGDGPRRPARRRRGDRGDGHAVPARPRAVAGAAGDVLLDPPARWPRWPRVIAGKARPTGRSPVAGAWLAPSSCADARRPCLVRVAARRASQMGVVNAMASDPALSVVIPMFNEEPVLPLLVDRLRPVLDGHRRAVRGRRRRRRQHRRHRWRRCVRCAADWPAAAGRAAAPQQRPPGRAARRPAARPRRLRRQHRRRPAGPAGDHPGRCSRWRATRRFDIVYGVRADRAHRQRVQAVDRGRRTTG